MKHDYIKNRKGVVSQVNLWNHTTILFLMKWNMVKLKKIILNNIQNISSIHKKKKYIISGIPTGCTYSKGCSTYHVHCALYFNILVYSHLLLKILLFFFIFFLWIVLKNALSCCSIVLIDSCVVYYNVKFVQFQGATLFP